MKRMVLRTLVFVFLLVFGLTLMPPSADSSGHGEKRPEKRGVLLVAFGSTMPEAKAAFENIAGKVKDAVTNTPIRWAFTSSIVREKLAESGEHYDSPELALARMMEDGFTHVVLASLHTIPGIEYHEVYQNTNLFEQMAGGFERLLVSRPLLSSHADIDRCAEALLQALPEGRSPDDAVVFMGHGTHHPSGAVYYAMAHALEQKDPHAYLGTVEGAPGFESVRDELIRKNVKKAYLVPFMSVSGDHAQNDMAGEGPDSWKFILEKAGIECVPVMKGTAEIDAVADIWVDHIKAAFSHF